ncbi:MAG: class I tRNA ligase family protein, partial [Janthinobacterium lividum]
MADLPKNYHFSEKEGKWQRFWQEQKIYKWDKDAPREDSFVVDAPPPTVSGQLHIGHVYSYTQTDFIVRFQRMIG